jgi:hypothetical protein
MKWTLGHPGGGTANRTTTADMDVLPGVLGSRTLRRTIQVRLGFDFGFRILDFGF